MNEEVKEIRDDTELTLYFKEYCENKDPRVIEEIIKYIKNDKPKEIKFKIEHYTDISDYEDKEGKTLFHYLIEKKSICNFVITDFIANSTQALYDYLAMNPTDLYLLNYYTDEDTFFKKIPGEDTLFDYLIRIKKLNKIIVNKLTNHKEIVDKINNYDKTLLSSLSENLLFDTSINSIRTIDYIFDQGLADKDMVGKIMFHEEIVDILNKNNRRDLLKYLNENILMKKKDDKYYLEILLDEGIVPETKVANKEAIKILFDRGLFDKLKDKYEYSLLEKIDEDKTLLEGLLENGVTPTNNYYSKEQSLLIMLKYNRYDLIVNCNIDVLLKKVEENSDKTYLDLILDEMKYGLPIVLSNISTYSEDVNNTAMFYIKVARHGYMNRLSSIDSQALITPKPIISILDAMLSIDKDITLNVILDDNLRNTYPVATYLRIHGYENDNMQVKIFEENNLTNEFFNEVLEPYKDIKLSEEDEALLKRFEDLMLSDGVSSEKLIRFVSLNYRRLINDNNPYARRELLKLCELKEICPEFKIVETKEYELPFHRGTDKSIHLKNGSINVLNHEMGHALFHNFSDKEVPMEFYKIVKDIREDKETMNRLKEFSNFFQEERDKVILMVRDYVNNVYKEQSDTDKLEEHINSNIDEKKKELLKYGHSEEDIDALFKSIYSLDEYQKETKRINTEELVEAVLRTKYGGIICILDIIDGIYNGKYRSGELVDNYGFRVPPAYGHGIAYYERDIFWVFDETIANYSAMAKSTNPRESLSVLKNIVGERFLNCIESYYNNQIVGSEKELKEL